MIDSAFDPPEKLSLRVIWTSGRVTDYFGPPSNIRAALPKPHNEEIHHGRYHVNSLILEYRVHAYSRHVPGRHRFHPATVSTKKFLYKRKERGERAGALTKLALEAKFRILCKYLRIYILTSVRHFSRVSHCYGKSTDKRRLFSPRYRECFANRNIGLPSYLRDTRVCTCVHICRVHARACSIALTTK